MNLFKIKDQKYAIVNASLINSEDAIKYKGDDHYIIRMNILVYKTWCVDTTECIGNSAYELQLMCAGGGIYNNYALDDIHIGGFTKEHAHNGIQLWKNHSTNDDMIFVERGYYHCAYIFTNKEMFEELTIIKGKGLGEGGLAIEIIHTL